MPELVIIDPSWAASQQAVLHAVPFPQTPRRYCPHRLRVLPRRPPGAAPRGRPPPHRPQPASHACAWAAPPVAPLPTSDS